MMNIVVDDNIPLGEEFFSTLGKVTCVSARELSRKHTESADVLIVRSVRRIDRELIDDTPVKFVGSCTAGVDHLDQTFLDACNIVWTGAPGCNANSVVDYVFSTLASCRSDWLQHSVGIIGCGNVGNRLREKLLALGVSVKCYDPLLPVEKYPQLTTLDEVLASSVVSIHAPLTQTGRFPSFHLLSAPQLAQLSNGTLLISAGRGGVLNAHDLQQWLSGNAVRQVVLDVWETEPEIPAELMNCVELGTPHIAGHSLDGKVKGTEMIYASLCRFMGKTPTLTWADFDTGTSDKVIRVESGEKQQVFNEAILAAYDVRNDSNRFRQALSASADSRSVFDSQRKQYPVRREFSCFTVDFKNSQHINNDVKNGLLALGFKL